MKDELAQDMLKQLALALVVVCVRNTGIEGIHSGIEPASAADDFSDVKVVTSYGEIPWNKTSRISNEEMRDVMREVVDRLYTSLICVNDPDFVQRLLRYAERATRNCDEPQNLIDWFTGKFDGG